MHEIVVASLLARDVADSAPEFTLRDDQCFIELGSSAATGNGRQIRNQVRQTDAELACGRIDTPICGIDVLMVVPSAEGDLNVARAEIGPQNIPGRQASIPECGVTVLCLIRCGKAKCFGYVWVIHQLTR